VTGGSAEFGEPDNDELLHLHALCGQFEEEWKTGRPQIGAWLTQVTDDQQSALLQLLVPLDIRCRRLRGTGGGQPRSPSKAGPVSKSNGTR